MQSIRGSGLVSATSIKEGGVPAISSTSLRLIAMASCAFSRTGKMKAPGPPITQSS